MTFNDLWLPVPIRAEQSQQRQWLLGYAASLAESHSDLEDYGEQAYLEQELWPLASRIARCHADPDEDDRALDALRDYCTAIADAPVDDRGERVRPEGLPALRAARERFLDAALE
ncbi:MAG: hypothetical protein ACQEXJ_12185 [Myxococcota bacterium]